MFALIGGTALYQLTAYIPVCTTHDVVSFMTFCLFRPKRGASHIVPRGPGPFEDQTTVSTGQNLFVSAIRVLLHVYVMQSQCLCQHSVCSALADGSQGINFLAPESNGGPPAQNPAHLASNGMKSLWQCTSIMQDLCRECMLHSVCPHTLHCSSHGV